MVVNLIVLLCSRVGQVILDPVESALPLSNILHSNTVQLILDPGCPAEILLYSTVILGPAESAVSWVYCYLPLILN